MEDSPEAPSPGLDLPWTETGSLARMILVVVFVGAVAGVAIGLSWRTTAGAQRPRRPEPGGRHRHGLCARLDGAPIRLENVHRGQ